MSKRPLAYIQHAEDAVRRTGANSDVNHIGTKNDAVAAAHIEDNN